MRCDGCGADQVSYNSRPKRHCPKCQASAAQRWLEARSADLLPVEYHHVVFTLPAPIAEMAYSNNAVLYGLLFDIAAQTLLTIGGDPKHLGARLGVTLVLHTWGSALTHHPHVHGIVPGGGLAPDGQRWVACRRGFFLPVRVLSRLFRRRFLEALQQAHQDGRLQFFGEHASLADAQAFARWLVPLRQCEWVVYAKRPFAGPEAVLAYLSRYTHRFAISNSRLVSLDQRGVTFRWKDCRVKGRTRYKTMTLDADEFMRRFLLHVLPSGFHRIRHYGLLANCSRSAGLAFVRQLLQVPSQAPSSDSSPADARSAFVCLHCGHAMIVVQTFLRGEPIRAPPQQAARHERQRPSQHLFVDAKCVGMATVCPALNPIGFLAWRTLVKNHLMLYRCRSHRRHASARPSVSAAPRSCSPAIAIASSDTATCAAVPPSRFVQHLPSIRCQPHHWHVARAGVEQT